MRTRLIAPAALMIFATAAAAFAVDKKKAAYMGGSLDGIKEKAEGRIDTRGDRFVWMDEETGRTVSIPYANVTELEYGQKAGHRVKTAILLTPLALFSKARHHYVTLTYKDEADKEQVVVFEFGKEIIRTDLKVIQVRSGQELKFTDDESKKQYAK